MEKKKPLPLDSLRVLDFSRILAGPYCTQCLGDLGAEVLKIERPVSGDDTRAWGPPFVNNTSAYFISCNRNKKSVTLNLKSEAGVKLALALAEKSDVVVENFQPGMMEALGLGHAALSAVNPKLVYCSITGFGQNGPRRDDPGYDILIQGMGGLMSITGEPEGAPMKVGVAVTDIAAGLFASNAILAALYSRERTGKGERIDVSLFDSSIAWLANVGSSYLSTGKNPLRYGNGHPSIVPYQVFKGSDAHFIVAVGNDSQWVKLCKAMERGDLERDSRFTTNASRVEHRALLIPLLERHFRGKPALEWTALLKTHGIPAGPINTLEQVFSDPQAVARDMAVEAGNFKMMGSPFKMGSTPSPPVNPPPALGEHTENVLTEILGLAPDKIEKLKSAGVI